ncbi:tyrosine-type recombinase/integrase [Nonomuraea fuscirosea]|uniref:tyrosine-type recombinase/integrase n=1 Tax=Nonomuraea fuscirosea TaxID=1291556 RepID=UPI0033E5C6C5
MALLWSERKHTDGSVARVGDETLRVALARAAAAHLPEWADVLTPHVLRHFCTSRLYQQGMDLIAIQQLLGHAWIATTMKYVHVTGTHIEDAWAAGQQHAATRLEGLRR